MRVSALTVAFLVAGGIGCSEQHTGGSTVVTTTNPGDNSDGGVTDAGGGDDGGGVADMGNGNDAGGPPDMLGGPGPWPLDDLKVYGAAEGLGGGIIDANPDDAQNIWAASGETLYVLRPGSTMFQKFTAADGLHIGPFTDVDGNGQETKITAIAGGAAGQVYVGYFGYENSPDPFADTEQQKELGNGDDVILDASGKIGITRLLFRCDAERGNGCWENRSARRIIYSHSGIAAGHSWWGFNHGVTHVLGDDFGDHVHPEVWYAPATGTQGTEKIGEFYGIAPDAMGNLWMAGKYAVGLQPWNPKPHGADPASDEWVSGSFIYAFTTDTGNHELGDPTGPSYVPAGYTENNRGVAVTADGKVWFARLGGGLVSWDPATHNYNSIQRWSQAPTNLMDVQADPDGTLWLVDLDGNLMRFDPASGAIQTWPGVGGVTRIYVDSTVSPRALYVSMSAGVAVIRAK